MGKSGASLGILAQEIQYLSIGASEQTGIVISKLTEIEGLASTLNTNAGGASDSVEDKKLFTLSKDLEHIFGSISAVIRLVISEIEQINNSSDQLRNNIKKAVLQITINSLVEEKTNNILRIFDEILTDAEAYKCINSENDSEDELMLKGYTMQIQRDIHNNLNNINNTFASEASSSANNNSNEFGDNVELF